MSYTAMELAEVFLKTGELDDALDALNQQLTDHPDDDNARRLRVQTNMRRFDKENLGSILDDLQLLGEKTDEDYQTESIIHQKIGNIAKAIQAIEQAMEIAPQERFTERLLDLLLITQDFERALDLIQQQDKTWRWLEREGDVLVLLGNDILATARYGLVLSHLSEQSSISADYLQALKLRVVLARAHAYRRLEHTDLAREHYEIACNILGDDVSIDFNLGLLAEMDGERQQAIQLCQSALNTAPEILRQSMIDSLMNTIQFSQLKESLEY